MNPSASSSSSSSSPAAAETTPGTGTGAAIDDPYSHQDPLPPALREGDHFLLHFADGRQVFAQALPKWRCAKGLPPCKVNKRTYGTHHLIGLPYGTVLEVGRDRLIPLAAGEDLLPDAEDVMDLLNAGANNDDGANDDGNNKDGSNKNSSGSNNNNNNTTTTTNNNNNNEAGAIITPNDNRHLVDDNTSQRLTHDHVQSLRSSTTPGSRIVAALVSGSATFGSKTAFSQAKYLKRKQLKYQMRCRIVRVSPATLCAAMHLKDARKISNLREDTLGRMLSDANVCAGQRVLVVDTGVQGIVSASVVRRMGGYGTVLSLFAGQQPSYIDVVHRMNLTVGERQCLKWASLGEVFGDPDAKEEQRRSLLDEGSGEAADVERKDREQIKWPAPLQPHTRDFLLKEVRAERKVADFLRKRSARFARKLTRHSVLELRNLVDGCRGEGLDAAATATTAEASAEKASTTAMDEEAGENEDVVSPGGDDARQCDSLIIATKYDPTATLLRLLPYLAPSCPFVVYHEFLEPLLETFRTLQNYYVPGANDGGGDDDDGNDATTTARAPPMMLRRNIAINLRLTDAWFREYQILEGRTHPRMSMSQNGGYLLTGTKLCPRTGTNELDDATVREIRDKLGGRRRRQNRGGGGTKKRNQRGGGTRKESEVKRNKT